MIAEENSDSFYVTLRSDASLNLFPDNKATHFINRLETDLALSPQEWSVGLAEFHVPTTFFNVIAEQNKVTWRFGQSEFTLIFEL